MGEWVLGIDFGTVSTVAAVHADGLTEVVQFDGVPRMPSTVFLREATGELVIGSEAERVATYAPDRAELAPKAHLGGVLLLGGQRVSVTEAVAAVLRRAADEALRIRAGPPAATILPHPLSWGAGRIAQLRKAADAAGLQSACLVPLPIAVATGFGVEAVPAGSLVAVYYLGASTFEASVLERTGEWFNLAGPPAVLPVGGATFDDALCRLLEEQMEEDESEMLSSAEGQVARHIFRTNVRAAKEQLSRITDAIVFTPPPVGRKLRVSRVDLERAIVDDVEMTVALLEHAIREAGVSLRDLAAVHLAGGSTRIPLVRRVLHERLGRTPSRTADPTTVAALGAARLSVPGSGTGREVLSSAPLHSDLPLSAAFPSLPPGDRPANPPRHAARPPRSAPGTVLGPDLAAASAIAEAAPQAVNVLDDDVQFTVLRPQCVQPDRWYPLLAFAHKSEAFDDADLGPIDPIEEVRRQAESRLGADFASYLSASEDSTQELPRGSALTFVPKAEGVEFNPPSRSFSWLEPVHLEEFRMRASPRMDGTRVRGTLSVFLGSILIADVSLNFRVASGVDRAALEREHAQPYRKIFLSYSHRDTTVVEQVERFLTVLGDEVLRDAHNLRSGEVWDERLEAMIREAKIFQLFWSRNSMVSDYVRKEWTYALGLRRPSFVRPTYWEQPMPELPDRNLPPNELKRLHFQYLPLLIGGDTGTRVAASVGVGLAMGGVAAGAPGESAGLIGASVGGLEDAAPRGRDALTATAGSPEPTTEEAVAGVGEEPMGGARGQEATARGRAAAEQERPSVDAAQAAPPSAAAAQPARPDQPAMAQEKRSRARFGLATMVPVLVAVAIGVPALLAVTGGGGTPAGVAPTLSTGATTSSGSSGGSSGGGGPASGGGVTSSTSLPSPTSTSSSAPPASTSTATTQPPTGNPCGGGLFVSPQVSCLLAAAVERQYLADGSGTSPLSILFDGVSYTFSCTPGLPVVCTAGNTTISF